MSARPPPDLATAEALAYLEQRAEGLPEQARQALRAAYLAEQGTSELPSEQRVQLLVQLLAENARQRPPPAAVPAAAAGAPLGGDDRILRLPQLMVEEATGEPTEPAASGAGQAQPANERAGGGLKTFKRSLAASFENLLGGRNKVRAWTAPRRASFSL